MKNEECGMKNEECGMKNEELKPVRCGCGGEAQHYYNFGGLCFVSCKECGITTEGYDNYQLAVEAWNKAMGITHERAIDYLQSTGWMQDHDMQMSAKDINVPCKERTAKVERKGIYTDAVHTGFCGSCGMHLVSTYDRYCPQCGAKLEWEEE